MDKSDQQFIDKRLDNLLKYQEEIEPLFNFSNDEIKKDYMKLRTSERLLQLIADEMVDVNGFLIKKLNLPVPDDFQSTFRVLGEEGIISEEFAGQLAPIVGLRNRLVHRYEDVDVDLFLQTIRKNKDDFKIYVKYISEFITRS